MRIVQIDARSADIILKRNFREDSDVKAGQILYQIDPAPLQDSYSNAQAALAKIEANLSTSTRKAQPYKPLVDVNAVSKQDYDRYRRHIKTSCCRRRSDQGRTPDRQPQSRLCHRDLANFRPYRQSIGHWSAMAK